MAVLAVIAKSTEIPVVLPWAAEFAIARNSDLQVMCWEFSPASGEIEHTREQDSLFSEVARFLQAHDSSSISKLQSTNQLKSVNVQGPDLALAAINMSRIHEVELLVAAAEDPSGERGATYATNPLLRQSPCNTVILFGRPATILFTGPHIRGSQRYHSRWNGLLPR